MRLFFLRSALVFLVIAAFFPHNATAGPIESSVWIEVEREHAVIFRGYRLPKEGEGMGVAVSSSEIVTAAHVVFGAKKISVSNAAGVTVSAEIVGIDEDADIAILYLEHSIQDFALIRQDAVVYGERVSVVRRQQPNEDPQIFSATVQTTNYMSYGLPVPLIFSGIKGVKGMSGGGLFDISGNLAGIVIRIDAVLGYLNALPAIQLCARFSLCASTTE